jgi:hypothetical protein
VEIHGGGTPMWHLETQIGQRVTAASGTWVEMRNDCREVLSHFRGPEKPTVLSMLAAAVPYRRWSCVAADCRFTIYQDDPAPSEEDADMSTLEKTLLIEHGDREHAEAGASSCYRWSNCKGSLNAIRAANLPRRTTPDAERGTAAHEVAHACLLSHQDAIEWVDRTVNNILIDEKIADGVQKYLDLCRSLMGDGIECFTERKFSLKRLNPPRPMFGTADFVALARRQKKVTIVDYKNGFLPVEAQGNVQLKYYVVGVLLTLPEDAGVQDIEVYIVQPNGFGLDIKKANYKVGEIINWTFELLKNAKDTLDPAAPLTAGPWCKFCGIEGQCATQAAANMDAAQLAFTGEVMPGSEVGTVVKFTPPELRLLTPAQLDALKLKFDEVKSFMDAVDAAMLALAQGGTEFEHWKMVAGLGHRKWKDEAATAKTLTESYQIPEDRIWTREMVSPATVEKLLRPMLRELGVKGKRADEMLAQAMGSLTWRPTTAPRLALSTDTRPAITAAVDMFTAEPLPEGVEP